VLAGDMCLVKAPALRIATGTIAYDNAEFGRPSHRWSRGDGQKPRNGLAAAVAGVAAGEAMNFRWVGLSGKLV